MKLFSFRGGVHPPDYKDFSKGMEIETLPPPKAVTVPLAQHLGVPATAIVAKGDTVLAGQKIGECRGFVSAAVHSPVAGTVKKVDMVPHLSGTMVPGIEIEAGEEETWAPEMKPVESIGKDSIIKAVQEAGIVGMGGATFPSHVKLQPPEDKKIELLILNAAECEPFLTCDYRLMLEEPERIIRGAELLIKALDVNTCIIGVEDNKPDAIEKLQSLVGGTEGIAVQSLKTHYPQGGEKQLIYALTKREVPSGGLPMDVGCVVHNVGTACAVADAVDKGLPLIERIVTVSGDAVQKPGNFKVRVGTPIRTVLEAAGFNEDECAKIVLGGPMTGFAVSNLAIPVTKGTSGILAFTQKWVDERATEACLRCGRCLEVCPAGLNPTILESVAMAKNTKLLQEYHAMDCIECGCCAYNCPSRRVLVHAIRYGKAQLAELRKAKKG
jgi:electron transport complex protein RnfC